MGKTANQCRGRGGGNEQRCLAGASLQVQGGGVGRRCRAVPRLSRFQTDRKIPVYPTKHCAMAGVMG